MDFKREVVDGVEEIGERHEAQILTLFDAHSDILERDVDGPRPSSRVSIMPLLMSGKSILVM